MKASFQTFSIPGNLGHNKIYRHKCLHRCLSTIYKYNKLSLIQVCKSIGYNNLQREKAITYNNNNNNSNNNRKSNLLIPTQSRAPFMGSYTHQLSKKLSPCL